MQNEVTSAPPKVLTEKQIALEKRREAVRQERLQRIEMAKLERQRTATIIEEKPQSLPTQEEKQVEITYPLSNIRSLKELLAEYRRDQPVVIQREEPISKPKEEPILKESNNPNYSQQPIRKRFRDWIPDEKATEVSVEKKLKTVDSWSMAKTVDAISAYGVQIVGALVLYVISCAARTYKPSGAISSVSVDRPPLPTQSYGDFYRNPYG